VPGTQPELVSMCSPISSQHVLPWLGHSQYFAGPDSNGVVHEFRIYDSALRASDIADSYAAGPDPTD
jgi:hypothetical protein